MIVWLWTVDCNYLINESPKSHPFYAHFGVYPSVLLGLLSSQENQGIEPGEPIPHL